MIEQFYKYQGTGNDFIVFDDRLKRFPANDAVLISRLCNRKFGIGSDGILLIQNSEEFDFEVDFVNPDGSRSFCGNGSRCAVAFARKLGMIKSSCNFSAIDGVHEAMIDDNELVHLKMSNVLAVIERNGSWLLDTGSPHFIEVVDSIGQVDVTNRGAEIRYNDEFKTDGVNVNFVEVSASDSISIRTYERGVEGETLSCGTGVTAAVLALSKGGLIEGNEIMVTAEGGELKVKFKSQGKGRFEDIWLIGPAVNVFKGEVNI